MGTSNVEHHISKKEATVKQSKQRPLAMTGHVTSMEGAVIEHCQAEVLDLSKMGLSNVEAQAQGCLSIEAGSSGVACF